MGFQREIAFVGSECPQPKFVIGAHHESCLTPQPSAKQDLLPTANDGPKEQRLTVE